MKVFARTLALGSVLAILAPAATLAAQAVDPSIGKWELNIAKSTFKPGPAPKSVTVTFETVATGTKVQANVIAADGKAIETLYTANADGKDYPVTGSPDYDAVSIKQIDVMTRETTRKMGGKVVQTATGEVSNSGKTLTVKTKGTNAKGEHINNVAVYDKV